jgi:paired amphipathic helix protein Sin3a
MLFFGNKRKKPITPNCFEESHSRDIRKKNPVQGFGNNNWYLFFRLHAILCERLLTIYERTKIMASEEEQHKSNRRTSTAVSLRLKAQSELEVPDYYPTFLELLKNLLDGNVDSTTYEDKLRDMYGIHAYITFTLDRVSSLDSFFNSTVD